MSKTIIAKSGHTIYISPITSEHFGLLGLEYGYADCYSKLYIARNWDKNGRTFFYLATGYHTQHINSKKATRELHVWYPNSKAMWSGMGLNMKEAIDGAQRDAWLYA